MTDKKSLGLIAGIVGLTVLLLGGLVWLVMRAPSERALPGLGQKESLTFNDAQDPALGQSEAKVVVHLYSDFQCPACKFAEPALQGAIKAYQDRVRFVWKDFPLEQIHGNARPAANAARCAEAQGKFWEYHETLYATQDSWDDLPDPSSKFLEAAHVLRLDEAAFDTCLSSRTHDDRIARNLAEGNANRVDRTPTFFIGTRRYFGLNPQDWSKALDQALQDAGATSSTARPGS